MVFRPSDALVNRVRRCGRRSRRRPRRSSVSRRRARRGRRRPPRCDPSPPARDDPRWSSSRATERIAAVGSAMRCPGDVGSRTVHRLEHAGERAVGVDVARGRQADAAADRAGQVGEDVAEEVVRDDDVESSRVGDEEDRRGVDVQVVDRDIGILGRHRVDRALPERPGEDEHVGLVHERELLARASGCRGERVAHDALDPERGVDGHLVRDLVRACRRGSRRRCRRTGPPCPRGRRRSRPRPGRRAGSRRPGTAPSAAGSRSGRARTAA